MATRPIVPINDNEGGIGTALKRWATGFFASLQSAAHTITSFTVSGFVKNDASGVLSGGNSIAAGDLPSGIDATKIGAGVVDNTEFGYLNGVASALQTQIDGKSTEGAWIDYTASSTIVGFASFTSGRKFVQYMRLGKLCFFRWWFDGVSGGTDGTKVTFTLPYNFGVGYAYYFNGVTAYTYDNGVLLVHPGQWFTDGNVVSVAKDCLGTAWTAMGNKISCGCGFAVVP